MYRHGLELRSKITSHGLLELFLQETPVPEPAADAAKCCVASVRAHALRACDRIAIIESFATLETSWAER
jgi:hypothetical protein